MLSRVRDVLIKIILAAFNLGAFAGIDPVFPKLGGLGGGREGVDRDLPGDVREQSDTHHDGCFNY